MKKPLLALCLLLCTCPKGLAEQSPRSTSVTVRITARVLPHCEVLEQPPLLTKAGYTLTSLKKCNNGKPPELLKKHIPFEKIQATNQVTHIIRGD